MKFTTLLFDADGTLLDFDATEKRALQRVFDLHHYPLTNEETLSGHKRTAVVSV